MPIKPMPTNFLLNRSESNYNINFMYFSSLNNTLQNEQKTTDFGD